MSRGSRSGAAVTGDVGPGDDPWATPRRCWRKCSDVEARPVVMHSIAWQYIPTDVRWRITEVIEAAGERATGAEPLAWVRYEPDEWDRRRAAVWLRTFPDGADGLVAHADYHGRWLSPR
ncbi:MAG: DUF2332 family protein [Microthrixaceae bacterium]|nr:DUF2332 family protein [Microthrixaceae bacterium]